MRQVVSRCACFMTFVGKDKFCVLRTCGIEFVTVTF